ncbi:MAG: SEC-C domain-containing protein [Peptostreptococcaceae bacterium]|nr:SEC-C domain-containing protein [Peptostreptococcaceae bacterium]
MKKIGRNEPCPCGSGRKYKKCCLDSTDNLQSEIIESQIKELNTFEQFPFIQEKVDRLKGILADYVFEDLVRAIFCINLCVDNRSALENTLALNLYLLTENKYGTERIDSYDSFHNLFNKIKQVLPITPYDDSTIEDFGEVKLYYENNEFDVILGTGYEQSYGTYQFLEVAVDKNNSKEDLLDVLKYSSNLIGYFKDINSKNSNSSTGVRFKLPSRELYLRVQEYFEQELIQNDLRKISKIFKIEKSDASRQHFIEKNETIYPLFNTSFLLDFYYEQIKNKTSEEIRDIVDFTIMRILAGLVTLENPKEPSVLFPVSLVDQEKYISKFLYTFVLLGRNEVIIGINRSRFSEHELKSEIKLIYKLHNEDKLIFAEVVNRNKSKDTIAIKVEKSRKIKLIIYDNTSELTQSSLIPKDRYSSYLQCLAVDMVYLLFFMSDVNELSRFINYVEFEKPDKLLTFGGISNLYLMWKESSEFIEKGAVNYNLIWLEHGYADNFVWDYYKDELKNFRYREDEHLFSCFYAWNIRAIEDGFYEYVNKISSSFGGNGKKYENNCFVFYVHNVDFFDRREYSDEIMGLISLIDDLNLRSARLYNSWFESNSFFNEMTVQIMHMPKSYAMKVDHSGFTSDRTRNYVYSDLYRNGNVIVIRYCVDEERLYNDIEKAADRSVEARYYLELLKPLQNIVKKEYEELVDVVESTIHLPKGVGTFAVTLEYLWSGNGIGYHIEEKAYHLVRKKIADLCKKSGVSEGEYEGVEANKIIRKMQSALIFYFETKISKFDRFELHKSLLSVYSKVIHNIDIHRKRYSSFKDIDENELLKFKQRTIKLREEERHHQRSVSYAIETNINIENSRGNKAPDQKDIEYIIAYSNWLVVLLDTADICHKSSQDQHIHINSDYVVDIIESEEMLEKFRGIHDRLYDNTDYGIKNDDVDKEHLDAVIKAFKLDTGIDLPLILSMLEYLQLLHDNKVAIELSPNVYVANQKSIIEGFLSVCEVDVDKDEISVIIDYLVIDSVKLKERKDIILDYLPINERVERDNRFDVKPLVKFGDDLVFSPVVMYELNNKWKSGILNFYLPYEIGLGNTTTAIAVWKKRYENLITDDLKRIFESLGYKCLWPNAWLHKLDKEGNHPEELGDYDMLAFDSKSNVLWVIECKVLSKVGSIHEVLMEQKNFFSKYDRKFQRRIDYIKEHGVRFLKSQGIKNVSDLNIESIMITNKVFFSRYKKIEFEIMTFHEFKQRLSIQYE